MGGFEPGFSGVGNDRFAISCLSQNLYGRSCFIMLATGDRNNLIQILFAIHGQ